MKASIRISALFVSLLLAGCGTAGLVDPGQPASVGDGVSVMPQVKWNQFSNSHLHEILWTQNGFSLDTLRFVTGIKSGKPLYPVLGVRKDMLDAFDAKMLPNDIQDLVVSTMEKEGLENVHPGNLAPCPFGTASGFCFDLDFATRDGLMMKGKVIASKRAGQLDLFRFQAPAEYYYDAMSPTVTSVFASITIK